MTEARSLRTITIDQAIAGASNLLIVLLAARVLDAKGLGLYGVIFTIFTICQGVSRALICDPLLVHPDEARDKPQEPIGTSLVVGVSLAILIAAAGVVATLIDSEFGFGLIALAVFVPLLIMQDLGRYIGFATGRPGRSVWLDSIWLWLAIFGAVALVAVHVRSLVWFVIVWGGTGAATGLLTFWQNRGYPIRPGIRWLRYTWGFSWRYLISYSSNQGAALAGQSAVGAISGAKQLGGVTGATILVRPFGTFQIAAVAAGTSGIARAHMTPREAFKRGQKLSIITTSIALVNGVAMVLMPAKLIELLLPVKTYEVAKPLFLATAAQIVGLGVITGARAGMLGLRAAYRTVKIDVTTTVVVLVSTVVGVWLGGVKGAIWAIAIGQGCMAVVWWTVFRWHVRTAPDVPVGADEIGSEELPAEEIPAREHLTFSNYPATDVGLPVVVPAPGRPSHEQAPGRPLVPWAAWR